MYKPTYISMRYLVFMKIIFIFYEIIMFQNLNINLLYLVQQYIVFM